MLLLQSRVYTEMMKSNASLRALDGKSEKLIELCRQFHVKRLEIFGWPLLGPSARNRATDLVLDFGDQPLVLHFFPTPPNPSKHSLAGTLI